MDGEEAWDSLHSALPGRWTLGRANHNAELGAWTISAVAPDRGRGKLPTSVTGLGPNELAAVNDLDARLRGEWTDSPRKARKLRARLRLAYLQGAEEWTRRELARSMTVQELEKVISRFPGAGGRP